MRSIKIVVTLAVASGFGAVAAYAQSANAVLARYGDDPALARAVSSDVAQQPGAAYGFCQAATNRGQVVQVYVGSGLAAAYTELVAVNDKDGAAEVAQVACGCGKQVSVSFSNSIGVPLGDICSNSWSGDYAGVKPYLWRLLATGGGNGVSRN